MALSIILWQEKMNPEQNTPYYYSVKTGKAKNKIWRTFFALRITEIENIYVNENDPQQKKIIATRLQLKQIDLINTLY